MVLGRMFAYGDSARYRNGPNYLQPAAGSASLAFGLRVTMSTPSPRWVKVRRRITSAPSPFVTQLQTLARAIGRSERCE